MNEFLTIGLVYINMMQNLCRAWSNDCRYFFKVLKICVAHAHTQRKRERKRDDEDNSLSKFNSQTAGL